MICPSCGKTILDSSTFCPFCGMKTVTEAAQPAPEPEQPTYQQPEQPAYQQPEQPAYQQPEQPAYQQPAYQQPAYQQPAYQPYSAPYQEPAPETTKPRSAYWAAILHLVLGVLGFGYYYRGMKDKAKTCIILFIVGLATTFIFGLGSIVILICQIINIVEAVKLFRGDYPTDAYGRTLYQEF